MWSCFRRVVARSGAWVREAVARRGGVGRVLALCRIVGMSR